MNKPVLKYYEMSPRVTAFSSTRKGGCSIGNHGEFNVNRYCGDDESCIRANREALCAELGIDDEHLIMPHQNHGIEIRQITPDFFKLPSTIRCQILENVDGVITDMNGVCVGVSTADCIPILLFDKEHHACAAVHAGWRGTVSVRECIVSVRFQTVKHSCSLCMELTDSCWQHTSSDEVVSTQSFTSEFKFTFLGNGFL